MIQQLRNPFLRHFSQGTPPFPMHNFLADQCSGWCFEDYVILERMKKEKKKFYPIIHLYQEPADGYIGSFIKVPKGILQKSNIGCNWDVSFWLQKHPEKHSPKKP